MFDVIIPGISEQHNFFVQSTDFLFLQLQTPNTGMQLKVCTSGN